jgi:RNA polymerase sigma-70 factor (ECF subfamily)
VVDLTARCAVVARLVSPWVGGSRAKRTASLPMQSGGDESAHPANACSPSDGSAGARPSRPDAAAAIRFQDLIVPHLDAAHNLARFLSRDSDAAQDIVQEAFLRAFRSFGDFRGGSPRAWILSIVRNCHHDWRVGRRRAPTVVAMASEPSQGQIEGDVDSFDPGDGARDEETPETNLLRRTEAEAVRAILDGMSEPFREMLVLRELEDLTYREIADVTALPIGTVMSRLARARKMFATIWRGQRTSEDMP